MLSWTRSTVDARSRRWQGRPTEIGPIMDTRPGIHVVAIDFSYHELAAFNAVAMLCLMAEFCGILSHSIRKTMRVDRASPGLVLPISVPPPRV
jgi:hypothetical protein